MFYPHKADPGMAFMPVAEAIVLQNSQMTWDQFPGNRPNKPRSPNDVASRPLPKSPVSSSLDNVVPQMIIRSPRARPEKFVLSDAKRLLQQYRSHSRHGSTDRQEECLYHRASQFRDCKACRWKPSTDLPDGLFCNLPVQPLLQKYFVSPLTQITSKSITVPSHRGAYRDRHGRGAGCGGRESVRRAWQSQGEMNLVSGLRRARRSAL